MTYQIYKISSNTTFYCRNAEEFDVYCRTVYNVFNLKVAYKYIDFQTNTMYFELIKIREENESKRYL